MDIANIMSSSRFMGTFMDRFLQYPQTAQAATWDCETCGVISPRPVTLRGETRYAKGQCACQIAELEQQLRAEQRRDWMKRQIDITYGWLGTRFDDRSLIAKTFDNFTVSKQPEAYEMVRMFILDMHGALVLHGTYGTGKTHLLAALCNELRGCHKPSLFTTAPKLFAAIQTRIQTNEDYSQIINRAMKTQLLVIDDIDKAKHSEFREEIYFEIVDERVKRGLPIALSTNRLEDLEQFVGGAVTSRLKVGQIAVEMSGDDYREGLDA